MFTSQNKKWKKNYKLLKRIHNDKAEKLLQQQTELKKVSVYNDTLEKQEVIVSKQHKI